MFTAKKTKKSEFNSIRLSEVSYSFTYEESRDISFSFTSRGCRDSSKDLSTRHRRINLWLNNVLDTSE